MPIYEFRCTKCGNIQEFLLTGSSQEIELQCKECQGEEMERVMSTVSYSMPGSPSSRDSMPSATTRNCGPCNSCSTLTLPGHTR